MNGRWQLALGVQAAAGQSSWLGVRLMLAYQALAVTDSPVFVGVQASAFALAGFMVAFPAGRVADRLGGSIVATFGLVVCILGLAIVLTWPTIIGMLLAGFFVGLGHICPLVGQQSLVSRLAHETSPDAAFGTLTASSSLGQLIGPPLVTAAVAWAGGGGAIPNTWAGLAACVALLVIALIPNQFLTRAERASRTSVARTATRVPIRVVISAPGMWRALTVGSAVIIAADLLSTFLPVWAVARGVAPTTVGILLALRALFTIASRFGMARLVARFGRKTLLITALALAVCSLVALPLVDVRGALIVMCLVGSGLGLPQPLTLAWVTKLNDSAGEEGTR